MFVSENETDNELMNNGKRERGRKTVGRREGEMESRGRKSEKELVLPCQ